MPEGPPQDYVRELLQSLRAEQQRQAQLFGLVPNLPRSDVSPGELMSFVGAGGPIEWASPTGSTQIRTMGDLMLAFPQHYGYGEPWDQKGWLDILSRARRARKPSLQLGAPEFQVPAAASWPPSPEAMPWRFGQTPGEVLQRQRERLYRWRGPDTTHYWNVPGE